MKHIIRLCIATSFALAFAGCLEFNRDALWNAPINEYDYCTYFKTDFPVGSMFVHRQDSWTDKRLDYKYELTVMQTNTPTVFVLDHGWTVLASNSGVVYDLPHKPILVDTSIEGSTNTEDSVYQVGDMFKSYGQYQYVGNAVVYYKGKDHVMKCFKRTSLSQDLVAEPYPFIYIR